MFDSDQQSPLEVGCEVNQDVCVIILVFLWDGNFLYDVAKTFLQIQEFKDLKERERELSAQEERKRLAELQEKMAEQAAWDRERYSFYCCIFLEMMMI